MEDVKRDLLFNHSFYPSTQISHAGFQWRHWCEYFLPQFLPVVFGPIYIAKEGVKAWFYRRFVSTFYPGVAFICLCVCWALTLVWQTPQDEAIIATVVYMWVVGLIAVHYAYLDEAGRERFLSFTGVSSLNKKKAAAMDPLEAAELRAGVRLRGMQLEMITSDLLEHFHETVRVHRLDGSLECFLGVHGVASVDGNLHEVIDKPFDADVALLGDALKHEYLEFRKTIVDDRDMPTAVDEKEAAGTVAVRVNSAPEPSVAFSATTHQHDATLKGFSGQAQAMRLLVHLGGDGSKLGGRNWWPYSIRGDILARELLYRASKDFAIPKVHLRTARVFAVLASLTPFVGMGEEGQMTWQYTLVKAAFAIGTFNFVSGLSCISLPLHYATAT